jgi:parvulin-like peptidyl-prolyl isomerase
LAGLKTLDLSHILVTYKYEAEDLARQLDNGKNFADLAKKYSKCSSSKNSGSLGTISLSRLDEIFAKTALNLKPNEVSKPIQTRFGYHLILRNK